MALIPDDPDDVDEDAIIIGGRVITPDPTSTPFVPEDSPPVPIQSHGTASGDPHLKTFDGLKYDLHAVGEFTLVESVDENLEVQIIPLLSDSENFCHF